MKQLSKSEFEKLTANTLVLSKDRHGLKVLETQDGRIFKLFRLKRTFSFAQFSLYVKRFADNANRLQQRSIPTINVIDFFKVPELQRDIVIYNRSSEKRFGTKLNTTSPNAWRNFHRSWRNFIAKEFFFAPFTSEISLSDPTRASV